jgi:uncharacterized protein (DUF736 family)
MNIGEFKQSNGRILGWIATRTIDLPKLGLRPVESDNDRAPVYEIVALNVGNRWVQMGALWEAIAKHTTGESFLQGTIDDPSLAEPLPIALFGSEGEGFRAAWRPHQRRDDFGPALRAERRAEGAPAEGGFGDSTAGPNGSLTGADGDIDEDIPF